MNPIDSMPELPTQPAVNVVASQTPAWPVSSASMDNTLAGSNRSTADVEGIPETLIRPRLGWQAINFAELYAYRDLFRFLVHREIKVRYAQSMIGVGWAILQPLFSMLIFSIVFGRLAQISSDGLPYALFSFTGLVPWLYFSNGISDGVNGLIANGQMLSKVYFPRILLPLSAIAARFIDFTIASSMMLGLMAWYGVIPNWGVVALPWILALMVLSTAGMACWLATFAIQYRDVKHAMAFVIQILMYTAPVVYPTSLIPSEFRWLYGLNPMVGVIEGLRAALLGSVDMPWLLLVEGSASAALIAASGMLYFMKHQRSFADVA